ncbi:MAG TPA: ABC transporter ATP-binding protein [Candidatus Dormibacteraeota bacterium]|nr:ABC transporter ATP-binding protein [Candidatus Dormibacteraeota bacterium]
MSGHEEEKLGKIYDTRLTRRLLNYLGPYRDRVIIALALSLAVAVLEAAGPYLFHAGIDWAIDPVVHHKLALAAGLRLLGWISLAYLASMVLSLGVLYGQVVIMQTVGQKAMYDLRRDIFAHLQNLPFSFYDRTPVGRLITRATTDVDALNNLFASGVVSMLNDAFVLLGFVGVMLWLNWRLALLTFAVMPLIFIVTWIFRNSVREANRGIRVSIARINAFLQEHISGMTVVQIFNREGKSREQFEERNRAYLEAYKQAIMAFALFYPTVEFLAYIAIGMVFWYGGGQVLTGAVDIGVLVAFMQYAQRFFRPIQDLSEKFNILQTAMASSERIFKLLDEPAPKLAPAMPARIERPRGEIEFRNVWFSYRNPAAPGDADWVLRDISFRIDPGEMIAVVGHTGAGKTTLIQLLLRFYEIQRGEILLDGVDIRDMDPIDLRRHFGVVLQDPFLFTGTIESNVRLGTEGIDAGHVEKALREVGLGRWIDGLPEGIRTPVSERGATFSVGQRQLISFARALAHRPEILILDEATSSVDTQTELLIREALERMFSGRTSIVIAHRLSTVQRASRILVMHKSRLREQGTHRELLALGGIYSRLYQLQYRDQELRSIPAGPGLGEPLTASD